MKTGFFALFLFLFSFAALANHNQVIMGSECSHLVHPDHLKPQLLTGKLKEAIDQVKRRTATILAITLGPLGVHRLYLGTSPLVPCFYILTAGGFIGVLPFIDFVVLLLKEDISGFENSNRILMWKK